MTTYKRLPSSVLPNHYDVKISIDLIKLTFVGETTIAVDVSSYYLARKTTTFG